MLMHKMRSFRSALWLFLAALMLFAPAVSHAQVAVSITVAPPALPVYVQPICPGDGYLWTPGYWAWSDDDGDYYFVPGTWVEAPTPGFLWTPGYWGWNDGVYAWNGGYWGPHIGFYGGVNYGFGYVGEGYEGGRWEGDHFFYNRSVNNVNVTVIHNVYTKTVVNNYNTTSRASFNGPGGVSRRPTAQEETYAHEQHTPATSVQTQHREEAAKDRNQYASVNHGKPAVAATAKPGEFKGAGVVPAKAAAPYKGATGKGAANKSAATNTRGEKPTGTAAKKTPTHSTTPAERSSEHKSPAATNEHKTESSEAKPAARENAARTESKPKSTTHTAAPKTETEKPAKESTPRKTESTPKATAHEAAPKKEATPKATTRESAPKTEAAPKATHEAAPKKEATPKATTHEAAPKATHESAPKAQPTHESAPKPEHEAAPKAQHESAPKPQPTHEAAPKAAPAQHQAAPKESVEAYDVGRPGRATGPPILFRSRKLPL
jgi:hypothetical protein